MSSNSKFLKKDYDVVVNLAAPEKGYEVALVGAAGDSNYQLVLHGAKLAYRWPQVDGEIRTNDLELSRWLQEMEEFSFEIEVQMDVTDVRHIVVTIMSYPEGDEVMNGEVILFCKGFEVQQESVLRRRIS